MTKQQYYDLLVKSAQDGTFPSVVEGSCRYRGKGKKRCPIGLLIPNRDYHDTIEGMNVDSRLVQKVIHVPEEMSVKDLYDIQEAHDNIATSRNGWSPSDFVFELNKLEVFTDTLQIDI